MPFLEETSQNIKSEYSDLYNSILNKMNAKNVSENSIQWGYDYCVLIDNSKDPESLTETIDDVKRRYGISITAKSGRKKSEELIKRAGDFGDIPSVFMKIAEEIWNGIEKEKNKENNLVSNLDSILKSVGKKGTSKNTNTTFKSGNGLDLINHMMNFKEPVYPELSDIKKVRPDIYQKYIDKSDGNVIIMYAPHHKECDEWGFISEPVLLATKRDNNVRFITEDWGLHYVCKSNILENESSLSWGGALRGVDKAIAASEGQFFNGWKRTKQYRLTKEEIESYLKSKIFRQGKLF